jgi:hypothetical protein
MASAKFQAMVHYVVDSCGDPHRLGATRLNKICWYSDTIAYRFHLASITDETYVKRKHGPVPKTILAALRQLEGDGKIGIREHEFLPGRKIRLFVSLVDPDVTGFDPHELHVIDYVVERVCNDHTATSISELSHDAIWDAANDGEEIPMAATLVAEPAQWTNEISSWALHTIEKAVGGNKAA